MKLHRILRTTALWQDYWGFICETAQNYLEESNCWRQHSKSPPLPHSLPTAQKPERWPGSSRWQPRQSRCAYLESPMSTALSQKPPFAKTIQHRTKDAYHQRLISTGSVCMQQCLWWDKWDVISSPTAQRMPSTPSLLPGKHREDGRAIPTNQNILKHWEPGTLCSLGNSQSQNKTTGKHQGRYTLLLEPHEWAPFCLVPPGACKHQPLDPSHQLLPPLQNGRAWAQTKAACFNRPLYGKSMQQQQ